MTHRRAPELFIILTKEESIIDFGQIIEALHRSEDERCLEDEAVRQGTVVLELCLRFHEPKYECHEVKQEGQLKIGVSPILSIIPTRHKSYLTSPPSPETSLTNLARIPVEGKIGVSLVSRV